MAGLVRGLFMGRRPIAVAKIIEGTSAAVAEASSNGAAKTGAPMDHSVSQFPRGARCMRQTIGDRSNNVRSVQVHGGSDTAVS